MILYVLLDLLHLLTRYLLVLRLDESLYCDLDILIHIHVELTFDELSVDVEAQIKLLATHLVHVFVGNYILFFHVSKNEQVAALLNNALKLIVDKGDAD